jgi:hypothetical protein
MLIRADTLLLMFDQQSMRIGMKPWPFFAAFTVGLASLSGESTPPDSAQQFHIPSGLVEARVPVSILGRWWIKDSVMICAIVLQHNGGVTLGGETAGKWSIASPESGPAVLLLTWNDGRSETATMVASDHFHGRMDSGASVDLRRDAIPGPPGAGDVKPTSAALRLEKELAGTTWEWGWNGPGTGDCIKFLPDGTIECPDWTRMGLVTGWEAKSGDVVRLTILNGRKDMLFAYLVFSEDHSSYTGTAFDNKILAESHKTR